MGNMDLDSYIKTVICLLKENGDKEAIEVVKPQNITIKMSDGYWNDGVDYYDVSISVSVSLFSKLKKENKIEDIQKNIINAFVDAIRGNNDIGINQVLLLPKSDLEDETHIVIDNSNLWKAGYYKVFISHLTKNRDTASNLKMALLRYGIIGFVAHENIEPTKEWQSEIEKALYTMDVLCAIIVPGFAESKWCGQELGFAMGRRNLIINIRKDADPYGFAGKFQGIQSKGKSVKIVAKEIFDVLCNNVQSRINYTKIIADLFLNSKNIEESKEWINILDIVKELDTDIVKYIHSKYFGNDNLNNNEIIELTNKLFHKYSLTKLVKTNNITESFNTDDLPF